MNGLHPSIVTWVSLGRSLPQTRLIRVTNPFRELSAYQKGILTHHSPSKNSTRAGSKVSANSLLQSWRVKLAGILSTMVSGRLNTSATGV